MEQSEIYTETIMNMILDAIDDIIISSATPRHAPTAS